MDLLGEGDVEPPEVGELARRVDLGLVAGLGLAQHRRGVQPVAPRAAEQVGRAQQHGGALVERQVAPGRGRAQGRLDRALRVLAGGVAAGAEHVGVVVRGDDVERRAARDVPGPVDGHRQLVVDAAELGERGLQARPLGAAGRVVADGLVAGQRGRGDGVHAASA